MHLAKCLTWMSKICFYRFFVCFKIPGLNDKRLRSQGTRGPHRLKPPWHIMTPTIVDDGKLQLSQLRLPKFPAISMVGDVSVVSWWSLGVSVSRWCLGVFWRSLVESLQVNKPDSSRIIIFPVFPAGNGNFMGMVFLSFGFVQNYGVPPT